MKDPEKVREEYTETRQAMRDAVKPTPSQIKYATELLKTLGYNIDYYDFEEMDRWEVSDLINDLKQESEK